MEFSEIRRERLAAVRVAAKIGAEPPPLETPFGASKMVMAAYAMLRREGDVLFNEALGLGRQKQLAKEARIDANAVARLVKDRERQGEKRRLRAKREGRQLRTRTDCSSMTVDEKKLHRKNTERKKPSRRTVSVSASPLDTAGNLTVAELEANLATLDDILN